MSNNTIDAEISRFDQLAATWWQKDGPMWPLHKLNDLRAPFIAAEIASTFGHASLEGLTVLDIGCGAGLLSEAMAMQGAEVTALDPAPRNIEIARQHAQGQLLDIDYRVGGVETLTCHDRFDVVLNMEVVEHVDGVATFLAACCSQTRPGGLHFVATINRTFAAWCIAIVGAEYVLRWLPRGTHAWSKFVTPIQLEDLLRAHHHFITAKTGVRVNPLTKRFSLSNYMGVNYMVASRRVC